MTVHIVISFSCAFFNQVNVLHQKLIHIRTIASTGTDPGSLSLHYRRRPGRSSSYNYLR